MTTGKWATYVATGCCALAAACGAAPAEPAPTPVPPAARLRAVLTGIDLPAGLIGRPRDAWVAPFQAKDADCRRLLDTAAGAWPGTGVLATAAATYQGERLGETVALRLTELTGSDADRLFDRLRAAIAGCTSVRSSRAGGQDRLRAAPLPLDLGHRFGFGPDVAAAGMGGRMGGFPYEMHLVFARSGGIVLALVHGGIVAPDIRATADLTRAVLDGIDRAA